MAKAKRKGAKETLMDQYLAIKGEHSKGILFFQCGDFYEMFFDDAVRAAELLDITLTSRNKHADEPVPMAGVPHHSVRGYIAKLTELGETVVVCDQVEDARLVRGKRVVKRDVVRIVTPGIVLDDEVLDPKSARYLAAITCHETRHGLAYLDVTTGELRATELSGLESLVGELCRARPHEVLAGKSELDGPLSALATRYRDAVYGAIAGQSDDDARVLLESALAESLAELGLADKPLATRATADVIAYARATQPAGNLPLSRLQVYDPSEAVVLDEVAVANLELVATLIGGKKAGTLLDVIDETRTAPGGRLLRRWLLYPLTDVAPIRRRQDTVEYFVERASLRSEVRGELKRVHDLERLAGRATLGAATPRDLGRLRDSLAALPGLATLVSEDDRSSALAEVPALARFDSDRLKLLETLRGELDRALVDTPSALLKDGGFIRQGFCEIVDGQRALADGGKGAILAIETRERERTGIPSLKIKYNKVFGYYIEVTKTHLAKVPEDYVRKQTITSGERYATAELAELETKVAAAQETLLEREQELFAEICARVAGVAREVAAAGRRVAAIDCCSALAQVAHIHGYARPSVDDGELIDIAGGRHPVVERSVPEGAFVPNDCRLSPSSEQILLITGPNMAGKSTYMRQVAQIVLLAQMGSFVPAERARIGLVDRVFTRVGAADNLARGESTFMVEMRETAAILRGATRRSLVVLDEVGRGTSTFDGVSIAWAVTEYLHDAIGARTVFATHYHELCMLAETRPRVRNVSVAVKEHRGEIVFLRQVIAGGSSRSYGIDVARLAGLPRSVISRGRQILAKLEGGAQLGQSNQLSLFSAVQPASQVAGLGQDARLSPGYSEDSRSHPPNETSPEIETAAAIVETLEGLDIDHMTPVEALGALADLRTLAKQGQ